MRISIRTRYALKALVDLALHEGAGPVTVRSIARRQQIPPRYLEQLFNRLRRGGIILSERGPRGGYRLGRRPGEISVSDVFRLLDSPPAAGEGRPLPLSDPVDPGQQVWRQVTQAVQTTLEAATLEELAAQALEQAPSAFNHPFPFHI